MKMIDNIMNGPLFKKMVATKGMKNLVFDIEKVIDVPEQPDVWVIYQSEKDVELYQSLQSSLWSIKFDAEHDVKTYQVEHSDFYRILRQEDGKRELAKLIKIICVLLRNIEAIGSMHFNLRLENIAIKFNKNSVEDIKFLGFGHLTEIEEAEH